MDQTQEPPKNQVVEVEAVDEGPKVKPKKVLTEAQLEALKRGREKLAEKRKQQKEAEETKAEPVEAESDAESEESVSPDSSWFCTVM